MADRAAVAISLSAAERDELERLARGRWTAQALALRVRTILMAVAEATNARIR